MFGLFKFRIEFLAETVSKEQISNQGGVIMLEEQTSRVLCLIQ